MDGTDDRLEAIVAMLTTHDEVTRHPRAQRRLELAEVLQDFQIVTVMTVGGGSESTFFLTDAIGHTSMVTSQPRSYARTQPVSASSLAACRTST